MDFEEALSPTEPSYSPEKGVLNIIWFTLDCIGVSVAEKLIKEGNNVIVAQIQSYKDMKDDTEEDEESKRRRLSSYDGIVHKEDAKKVLKKMKGIENKDEWIVWFDFNNMGVLAEEVLAMGFTRGLFPTTEDTALERDRDAAKEVVKEHYPMLSVAEKHDFKSVDDAKKFLEETEGLWVLKGNADSAKTIVPNNDDPELAKRVLFDALEAQKKDYETEGFILEEKIIGGLELTPQIVFLDGKVVFTDIDIENKNIGAGNIGIQTGAMQTLVVKTKLTERINKIAFPPWVYEQAKKHKGLFITDAGLIVKGGQYFFTEFCFQRFGYDSFFAEMLMAGSCTSFFEKLFAGENPLKDDFGVAVRGLNLHKDSKERRVLEGISMTMKDPDNVFVFECKEEDGKRVTTGSGWDMVVFSGSGDTVNEAIRAAYDEADGFAFEDMHIRPEFDMTSYEYPTSIANRYSGLNHRLFEAEDMANHQTYMEREAMESLQERVKEALYAEN